MILRRVNVVELVEICLALAVDPAEMVGRLRDTMAPAASERLVQ